MQKKGTHVLLSTTKDVTSKAKMLFKMSKQKDLFQGLNWGIVHFLICNSLWDMTENMNDVLLSTTKDITPRAKMHFKSSRQKVSWIKLRYWSLFYLKRFLRNGWNYEIFNFPIFARNYKITK